MLQEIHIQNLALIERLQLNLAQGFTSLTGETGAGKSILLDGLGLVLGERADSSLVRHGEERAEVSAQFDIALLPQVQAWLQEQALDDDDLCLLRRIVNADGRSKAYINGRPVPASSLKALGNLLVDIHGQHEHQSLLTNSNQQNLVDAYGHHQTQLEQVKQAFKHWQKLKHRYDDLQANQAEHQSKLELIEFQLNEFNKLSPQTGEFEALSDEQSTLAHASEIKRNGLLSYEALDGEVGATHLVSEAIQQLEQLGEYTPTLNAQLSQLHTTLIDLQEAANDIHHFAESVELDPERLNALDERLSALYALAKKYHLSPEDLTSKHQQLQQAFENLNLDGGSLDELKIQIDQAWLDYEKTAQILSKQRKTSAKKLSQTVSSSMQTLGMAKGEFKIDLTPLDKPSAQGSDRIEFLVSANPGQPAKPLAKVASGGELSRISLAIQVASAEVAQIPTLIFDEVDVGIGGGIAEVVGQKMQQLGQHRQVLSITHLGQVAAYGNQHLNVSKQTSKGKTLTQVTPLNPQARIEEIARMVGGLEITEQTLKHAQEMLERAQLNLQART
ncbi:MAG: DNA repair protein RecN [Thiomicrospira sp.]|uniref:DNA repair protein RecN n=1 Tax=Thiomicrospira sp. TaxID=935 RepID=UPI0019DCE82F|nr:DNA repair protein RecN [Thiomicrospira sp.]MBE0493711.1 DNA repair protein RecN [Thiomicrospira sp.]